MGEARRRGNRDERIAQAVARHQEIEARDSLIRQEARRREEDRIRNLPPEIRRELVLRRDKSHTNSLMLAAAMALAIPSVPGKSRGR